jgi:putative nucleotidyltransferase with HDIG domain
MADQLVITTNQSRLTRKVRVPIRTKLTFPYLLLTLILATAAAFLITQLVVENVQERFDKQLFEVGKISSELMVTYESQLLETQRLLANVEGGPAALQARDPQQLRNLTLGIIANDQQEAAEFLDLAGNHVLSIHQIRGGNPEDYEVFTGGQTSFSGLEIVQNVLSRKVDARGDKFADIVETDNGKFLYVAGPIYDEKGALVGVVLVGRSLPAVAADMRFKTFAQISFYDLSGQVLYTTLPYPYELAKEYADQAIASKDASSLKRNLDVVNIPYAEILGSWEVRGEHQIGVLGAALSENSFVQMTSTSRWRIFLLVAAANFLVILVGFNLANAITRPLLRLVQASQKVADGDLNVKVDAHSNDEVSLLTDVFNTMVANLNHSQKQLIRSYDDTLEGWAKALELRDKETEGHSERVTVLTVRLAEAMGIQGDALVNIRRGALLHDIGKMGTPDAILNKNGPLDEEERRIIEKHPQHAYDMLRLIEYLEPALEIPYCHHEKWDGTGYPRKLKGEEIPISARMFAVVDVFDALHSDRPYRKAWALPEVFKYLKDQSGSHFDPRVVEAFIRLMNAG